MSYDTIGTAGRGDQSLMEIHPSGIVVLGGDRVNTNSRVYFRMERMKGAMWRRDRLEWHVRRPIVFEMSQRYRHQRLERTIIRPCSGDHDPDVEEETEKGEGDDGACNIDVDRPHVAR